MEWRKCYTEILRLRMFIEICFAALDIGINVTEIVKRQKHEHLLRDAERMKSFSQEQESTGFPYLFSLATVKLWSILETMADDIAVHCIGDLEKCTNIDLLKKLKGPLIELLDASSYERNEYLASELKLAVKANLKPGIKRFEAIFEPLGMSGKVDSDVSLTFLELCQVRNVLVHRSGIADKRLVERCAWLPIEIGNVINVTYEDYMAYLTAANWYMLEVDKRYCQRKNVAIAKELLYSQDELIKFLKIFNASRPLGVKR